MKALAPDMAVFFVKCNRNPPAELTDSMTESGRNEVLDNLSEKDDGLAPALLERHQQSARSLLSLQL